MRSLGFVVPVAILLLASACPPASEDSAPPPEGDTDTDADTDSDTDADADTDSDTDTVSLSGRILEADLLTPVLNTRVAWNPEGGEPIETWSGENGSYQLLGLEPGAPGALELSQEGYARYLVWRNAPERDASFDAFQYRTADIAAIYDSAAMSPVPGAGTVAVQLVANTTNWLAAVGAEAALDGATANGPFYAALGSVTEIDPEATQATGTGLAFFTNVAPGEATVGAQLDGVPCTNVFSGDTEVAIRNEADTLSVIIMLCRGSD